MTDAPDQPLAKSTTHTFALTPKQGGHSRQMIRIETVDHAERETSYQYEAKLVHACATFALRAPAAHQIRQAPSSDTMHGPMGWRGVQALP